LAQEAPRLRGGGITAARLDVMQSMHCATASIATSSQSGGVEQTSLHISRRSLMFPIT
jgi:hypothetical protein